MKNLFVFWQDSNTRQWFPVGRLTWDRRDYVFRYTKGAKSAHRFVPFGSMRKLSDVYKSAELFPFFSNRVLSPARPEYAALLESIGLEKDSINPLTLLSSTGGGRATDTILIYEKPARTRDRKFVLEFFCHGIRHLPFESLLHIRKLSVGTKLYPLFDVCNPHDENAVGIRTEDPAVFLGYVPRFFAKAIKDCIQRSKKKMVNFTLEKVNPTAPAQLLVRCRFEAPWPRGLRVWEESDFRDFSSPKAMKAPRNKKSKV